MKRLQSRKELVAGTNDSCTVSKCSIHAEGYFRDDFVSYFTSKSTRRSPLINRGYYIRAKAIQKAVLRFLEIVSCPSQNAGSQIITLGAGFDSTFFRLKFEDKLPANLTYYEVDFDSVVKNKLDCIRKVDILKKLTQFEHDRVDHCTDIVLETPEYKLLAADLEDVHLLKDVFLRGGVVFERPTFLLSECVLTYLHTERCDSLIAWLSANFPHSVLVVYEQILPDDGFGLVMRKHFDTIGSPLRSITAYPSVHSQKQRYLSLGWKNCNIVDLNEFYFSLPEEERQRSQSLQPFDEFEEFHQKCSHYIIACSQQGYFLNDDFCDIKPSEVVEKEATITYFLTTTVTSLRRFSHDAILLNSHTAMVVGGFGVRNGKHCRLGEIELVNITTGESGHLNLDDPNHLLGRRMHHKLVYHNKTVLLTGGRESPSKAFGPLLRLTLCDDAVKVEQIPVKEQGPIGRWRHSVTLVTRQDADFLVIYGGRTPHEVLGDCFCLDLCSYVWHQWPSGVRRHSHAASYWNGKVIVSGGLTALGKPLSEVHSLDVEQTQWKKLSITGLIPRYSHTSHIWKDTLILIGGVHGLPTHSPGIAIVSLMNFTCREFTLLGFNGSVPVLLFKHSSLQLEDGQIVVLGGGGNCFSFGTHFNPTLLRVWRPQGEQEEPSI